MSYKLIRIDGKEDKLTSYQFDNYKEAYDLLNKIYGDICCSDIGDEDLIYYDIVENNKQNFMNNKIKSWEPSKKDNLGIISNIYKVLKEEVFKKLRL